MAPKPLAVREAACLAIQQVTGEGRSLSQLLPELAQPIEPRERALLQELCYGTLRWLPRLDWYAAQLLDKPLKNKDREVQALLLVGLYQLAFMEIAPHAAVSQTVAVAARFNKPWAKGLVNAILRRFQRERLELDERMPDDEVAQSAHPLWLLKQLQQAWPQQWREITTANNQRPPLTLRVNRRHQSRDAYLAELRSLGIAATPSPHAAEALTLASPLNVEQLPGFSDGRVSVQDGAAQLAAHLVAATPGTRVLDACAAPGGKTGHLLELYEGIALLAIDQEPSRLARVAENLQRLRLNAELLAADAGEPASWWDGRAFERILLDAPCSATGVIRRHPDIKILRRPEDIDQLVAQQQRLLAALWPLLAPGGMLVYATCSVLPRENHLQISAFLAQTPDARELPINATWGEAVSAGRQILPGRDGMDGFYYACLVKQPKGKE
ncbi:MAG TPA: 16S rRNA (cytosine(967)-C(5))-methyltransferase RsmB [Gammaproteobacteria bacterium]